MAGGFHTKPIMIATDPTSDVSDVVCRSDRIGQEAELGVGQRPSGHDGRLGVEGEGVLLGGQDWGGLREADGLVVEKGLVFRVVGLVFRESTSL